MNMYVHYKPCQYFIFDDRIFGIQILVFSYSEYIFHNGIATIFMQSLLFLVQRNYLLLLIFSHKIGLLGFNVLVV